MTTVGSRLLAVGDSRVRVNYRGRTAQAIVEFLYGVGPDATSRDSPAGAGIEAEGAAIVVRAGAEVRYVGRDEADAARVLQESTTTALAGACRAGLVLHAAAASCDDRLVLLPAFPAPARPRLWQGC
jgi:hypothetical protein